MGQTPLRVTLAALNSQYVHAALAPWCLKAGLDAYARVPFEAAVVEGTVNEPLDAVLSRIADTKPDVLGLCCYIWNIGAFEALLPLLRARLPQAVIVLGGPEVSPRAQDALTAYPEADYLIAGEGELPFARLVEALGGVGTLQEVPGLCRRTAHGIEAKSLFFHDAMPPSPITDAYIQALSGRIAYMETSRGCPYSCAFCLSGGDDKPRWQPLEDAKRDILKLAGAGSQTIKFVDRTFNANRKRATALLQFIKDEAGSGIPHGICFHFEIAGDLMDADFLRIVGDAPKGLFQFEIGMQSMDEHTLLSVRRRTDMKLLRQRVRALLKCKTAHVHLDLIAGLPHEDLTQFAQGFDQAYALRPHALQLGFLKLIHGSAMREQPEIYPCRYDPAPPYQVVDTPWLSAQDLMTLTVVERGLDRLHNSGRFPRTLDWLIRGQRQRPFTLFHTLGQAILSAEAGGKALSLDALTDCLYHDAVKLLPAYESLIRDLLVLDRLSTTRTTTLPPTLKRRDNRYFSVRRGLERMVARASDTTRAVALLYQGRVPCAVYCDYAQRDPVTGLYPITVVPLHRIPAA